MQEVPKSLRIWFVIHFLVDFIFAVPLFVAPGWVLGLFGITVWEPVTARLVAAALVGIGGASLYAYKKEKEHFSALLTLKILWSLTAIAGLIWSIFQGAPTSVWIIVAIFAIFSVVWIYYRSIMRDVA